MKYSKNVRTCALKNYPEKYLTVNTFGTTLGRDVSLEHTELAPGTTACTVYAKLFHSIH